MINSKAEYRQYLMQDLNNNYLTRDPFDPTERYLKTLRKLEYHTNCRHRLMTLLYKIRFLRLCHKNHTFIGCNSFGPGLSIAHFGGIIVNSSARIGCNCRISQNVTIGATNGKSDAAIVGNNVFIGAGALIIGNITIADDVAIGAGAVVIKSITEPGTTWAGNPARKISNNNSHENIKVLMSNSN